MEPKDQGDLDFSRLASTLPEWQAYGTTADTQVAGRIATATVTCAIAVGGAP